jgi:hypothetical protein
MSLHRLAIASLNATAFRLEDMALACHTLGHSAMGEKLLEICESIRRDADICERKYSEEINERFQDAQTHSAAMLATICHLGGVNKESAGT